MSEDAKFESNRGSPYRPSRVRRTQGNLKTRKRQRRKVRNSRELEDPPIGEPEERRSGATRRVTPEARPEGEDSGRPEDFSRGVAGARLGVTRVSFEQTPKYARVEETRSSIAGYAGRRELGATRRLIGGGIGEAKIGATRASFTVPLKDARVEETRSSIAGTASRLRYGATWMLIAKLHGTIMCQGICQITAIEAPETSVSGVLFFWRKEHNPCYCTVPCGRSRRRSRAHSTAFCA